MRIRITIVTFVAALAMLPAFAFAHGGDEGAEQNPALLAALVRLGGGADRFRAATFRRAVSTAPAEEKNLRAEAGAANVDRFDDVFTYVVRDALATMKRSGKALPPPVSTNPKAVARALYRAGSHDGAFDVERCFDTMFSPAAHNHAMLAVGRKYGAAGENAYHAVFARLIVDTGKP